MNKETKLEKFVFETDFFEVAVDEEKHAGNEEALAQAESKGYSQGLEKGQQQAMELFHSELELSLNPLKDKLEQFIQEKNEIHRIIQEKAVVVLSQVVELLFKHLNKELGEETLAKAISNALNKLTKDIHIVVRANQKSHDFLSKHDGIKLLFANKDTVLKIDESLSIGECFMEWEDAGVKIDLLEVTKSIEETLQGLIPNTLIGNVSPKEELEPMESEELESNKLE